MDNEVKYTPIANPVANPLLKKKFAIWKAPAPTVFTYDEAVAAANKEVLGGQGQKMYILEIVGVVEPITHVVDYVGE